jgi:hypothetical protein
MARPREVARVCDTSYCSEGVMHVLLVLFVQFVLGTVDSRDLLFSCFGVFLK